ncbi:hypothetical protein D8M04_00110 [Oceanobacillus piezotolerans]|uniref:Uncharacterized protein n=1 Tax=Oceanobacillus piezotolerans TaxID=2448030 RepID=A0A498DDY4_9BACI|nr:hypothetical protein [Oceanobacillus piezotolerans]RLL47725.1 hypothetical protein D8M04_00110 [Oceanobacillus piezotolerans]
MDNRGMMTSLLTIGAAGAAIYGITKGVQNGTFQKLPQQVSNVVQNAMNNQTVQQIAQPLQNVMNMQNSGQSNTNQNQDAPTTYQLQQHVGSSGQS